MPQFQVGGTIREGSLYVVRAADAELSQALRHGEFCYVLAPRQIGKSSLRLRTKRHLEAQGIRCVSLDLTQFGGRQATSSEWYFDLTYEVGKQLGLPDATLYWQTHSELSPLYRWSRYLRDLVLTQVQAPVVIFLDELDALLAVPGVARDDFFAAIRALYNARADDEITREGTAYELAREGHKLTVFEQRGSVAGQASFANAGLLAPELASPWPGPWMSEQHLQRLCRDRRRTRCCRSLRPTWLWPARRLLRWRKERAPSAAPRPAAQPGPARPAERGLRCGLWSCCEVRVGRRIGRNRFAATIPRDAARPRWAARPAARIVYALTTSAAARAFTLLFKRQVLTQRIGNAALLGRITDQTGAAEVRAGIGRAGSHRAAHALGARLGTSADTDARV